MTLFIDVVSKFKVLFYSASLTAKALSDHFIVFDNLVFAIHSRHVGVLRADNGSDFRSRLMRDVCQARGIQQQYAVPYKHGQAGFVEVSWRNLNSSVLAIREMANLPKRLHFRICDSQIFLENRMPGVDGMTLPFIRPPPFVPLQNSTYTPMYPEFA